MAYDTAQARQELLDTVGEAADRIGLALAAVGEAYEQLDDHSAERLESELFMPIQTAYGRAKSTHAEFAGRHGLPRRAFEAPSPGLASKGAKGFIDTAVAAASDADRILAALQDSMRPVEVGDAELRAGLSEVRRLVAAIPGRARELARTIGR
jgi:hypothetical protein